MTSKKTRDFQDHTALFDIDPELIRFRQKLVLHRVFQECERTILGKIAHPGSFNIVPVVGPSGTGKTQLLNEVTGQLLQVPCPSRPQDTDTEPTEGHPPYLPVIFVVAKTGRTYESRYRSLLIEILEKANEVILELGKTTPARKVAPRPTIRKSGKSLVMEDSGSISKLPISRLEALVRWALEARNVRAVLVDEAQHLVPFDRQTNGYASDFRLIADGLKLLSQNSNTLIVLFGTAELLSLPTLSAQLGRRSELIHFRRYCWQVEEDRAAFQWAVEQFSKEWPDALPKRLLSGNLEFLYAGCLGCIGILSDWLAAAMNKADKDGSSSVTLETLRETALRKPRLHKILTEALECEREFKAEELGPEELIETVCGKVAPTLPGELTYTADRKFDGPKAPKRSKRKPGKRVQAYDKYDPLQNAA